MNTVLLDYLAAFIEFLSGFGIVRVIIAAAILIGLWLGLQRAGFDNRTGVTTWLTIAVPLLVGFVVVWQLALAGVLPPMPVAIVIPVLVGLVLLVRSRGMADVLDVMPPTWLVGLQVYRVFGAVFRVQWAWGACRVHSPCRRALATFWSGCSPCRLCFISVPAREEHGRLQLSGTFSESSTSSWLSRLEP